MSNTGNLSKEKNGGQNSVNETKLRAIVHEIDGELVIEDPDALAIIAAINKSNCKITFDLNFDRIAHFTNRAAELGKTAKDAVIVVINVDDKNGTELANMLMTGHDWQQYRDKGETPFARGLAFRDGIQECLESIDEWTANKLREMSDLAVVVIDFGVAEVYPAVS